MKSNKFITFLKNKFTKSEFSKNVFTLISGTAIAQLIPLLIAPILSRIYTPEDFGRLALYLSIVQILGSIANGRYELAIILPKEKKKGVQLTILAILITIGLSIVSLVVVLFFSLEIAMALGDEKLDKWLYLVPLSVLMIGIFNALNYFNTREKAFKNIAKANVFKAFGGNITQLGLGFVKFTSGGLIIGQVFSHFFGNIKMAKTFLINKEIIKQIKRKDLKKLALRYINFPKFSMWGIFLNTMSVNLINFFISGTYSLSNLGQYSYAYKYIGLPISLIGNSISQVYFQKISERKEERQFSLKIFNETLKKLIVLGLIIFFPLFFTIEYIYVFVFGEEWRLAGRLAKILIPLFFIRFISVPLTISNSVFEKQKISFYWQIGFLALTVIVLFFASFLNLSLEKMLVAYSIVLIFYYILLLFIISRIISGKYEE